MENIQLDVYKSLLNFEKITVLEFMRKNPEFLDIPGYEISKMLNSGVNDGYIERFEDTNKINYSATNKCRKLIEEIEKNKKEKAEFEARQSRLKQRKTKLKVISIVSITCVVIAFVIVLNTVIIPNFKYNNAIALMDAGKYTEALTVFEALDGYKDSVNKIEKCIISIYGEEVYNKIKSLNVGDIYKFGSYEYEYLNGQEAIEWLVLEKERTKILVISKYALDCEQYNTNGYVDVTWETCTLREWLNNDFLNAAFSTEEKAMIPTVAISADKNPEHSTYPGSATRDRVFLLSITEANRYFKSDSARECEPTHYAVSHGANKIGLYNCQWWLRSPGCFQHSAAIVDSGGFVDEDGYNVDDEDIAVRPAMWIDLSKIK